MRSLIVTPLFPPDTAVSARYVKTLAQKLPGERQILLYGHLPEQVDGVTMTCIEKRHFVLWRVLRFTIALLRAARRSDVILLQNGQSTELPALLLSYINRTPIVLLISDEGGYHKSMAHWLYRHIHQAMRRRAHCVIALDPGIPAPVRLSLPPERPEIHPLADYPQDALERFAAEWDGHLAELQTHFV